MLTAIVLLLLAFLILAHALRVAVSLVGGREVRQRNSVGLAYGVTLVFTVVELFCLLLVFRLKLPLLLVNFLMTCVVALSVMLSYQLSLARSVIIALLFPFLANLLLFLICWLRYGSEAAGYCGALVFP